MRSLPFPEMPDGPPLPDRAGGGEGVCGDTAEFLKRPMAHRNYRRRKATSVAVSAALVFMAMLLVTSAYDLGGGSLVKGWHHAWGMFSFYGWFALPFAAGGGLLVFCLCTWFGQRIVMIIGAVVSGFWLYQAITTSDPVSQLRMISGKEDLPNLNVTLFEQGKTFSDGTAYKWIANCSLQEAMKLMDSLDLEAPKEREFTDSRGRPFTMPSSRISDMEGNFGEQAADTIYATDEKGFIAGYSESEGRLQLFYWPAMFR